MVRRMEMWSTVLESPEGDLSNGQPWRAAANRSDGAFTDLSICTMKLSTLCATEKHDFCATESRIQKINLQKTKFCDCKNNLKQRKNKLQENERNYREMRTKDLRNKNKANKQNLIEEIGFRDCENNPKNKSRI
jgi:hypothetical protein